MLTSNNLYNFSSNVLTITTIYCKIRLNLLYYTKRLKDRESRRTNNIISNRLSVLRGGIHEREIHTV